jgi:transposase
MPDVSKKEAPGGSTQECIGLQAARRGRLEVLVAGVAGGEWRLAVQTTATAVDFRGRGARAELHGRRTVRVGDLPSGGCPVVLSGAADLALSCASLRGRHLGRRAAPIRPRAVLTQRACAQACRRVGKDAHAVAAVAGDLGVGWATVMRAVGPTAPRWWTTLLVWRGWRPSAWTRDERSSGYSYGADPMDDRSGRPGARPAAGPGGRPHQAAVDGWPQARPFDWLAPVGTAALDPRRGYASALIAPLGHVTVVGTTSTPSGWPTRWPTRHADS